MAKILAFFVCIFIIALDVGAGICGIQAEIAENKAKHLRLWIFECKHPSQEAFKLGVAAAGLLIVAHIIANLFGGCSCIFSQNHHPKSYSNQQFSYACLLFTWIVMAIGLGMLVTGTLSNEKAKASCGFSNHHMMSIGGILCFVHALFAVAYYVSATSCGN